MARQLGKLPHPSAYLCAYCGAVAQCYEHREYTRPSDVKPSCASCNVALGAASINISDVLLHIEGRLCFWSYTETRGSGVSSTFKHLSKRGWKKSTDAGRAESHKPRPRARKAA